MIGAHRSLSQRGAALAYVLALLAIMSLLVGTAWRMIRSDNALTARDRGEMQARLLAHAGLDHTLFRIGPPGPRQDLGYATEGLVYRVDDSGRVFNLSVRTRGLYARAVSVGTSPVPPPGLDREKTALIGQSLDLSKLPALGLLNHEGNLVLAGKARIEGQVMLWRGSVRKATDYHVRFAGGPGHSGAVTDSTADAWKRALLDTDRAARWMEAQARMLAARDFSADGDFDSGMVSELRLPDSAVLADTALERVRIIGGVLRIASGARLKDCKVAARKLTIQDGATLQRVIAYAQGNLVVTGGSIRGGQFLAGDSLRVAGAEPLRGFPFFYAQGRMARRGRPDSAMVGELHIGKAAGEGIFVSACREHPEYDQEIRLDVDAGAKLTGLVFTPCHARIEGEVRGSVLCRNLKFESNGTIWLGHLRDARLSALPNRVRIPAPLLFPGFAPAAFATEGI